jgi:GntR family transcriptional regulator
MSMKLSIPRADAAALTGQSRYGVLAEALRGRVLAGEWQPGQNIPAEATLAQAYGVALGTMRQALALLVQDGILQRQHGRGTFVSRGLDDASMMRFFRFQPGDASQEPTREAPASRILRRRLRHPSVQESQAFGMERDGQVLQLERLRSVDGRPCLLETIVLPLPLFGPLVDSDTADWGDLLYPLYQQRCKVVVHHAQDELAFSQLNATQASRLRLPAGHPCVQVQRQAYSIGGDCIERRTTRGDAWSFTYTAQVR